MKGFLRLMLVTFVALSMVRCATGPADAGDTDAIGAEASELPTDLDSNADSSSQASNDGGGSLEDELNQAEGAPSQPAASEPAPSQDVAASPSQDSGAVDEFAQFENETAPQANNNTPPPAAEEPSLPPQVDTAIEPPPPEVAPPPIVETAPTPEPTPAPAPIDQVAHIRNIKYKANDNGGTVVVEADAPLTFETRSNPDTNQFIIEVPNSQLPAKLKRPFNTRDMKGGIGSVDAYQTKGSSTTRIVVQLRAGVPEPTVQPEGNSLLVVQSGGAANAEPTPQVSESATPQEGSTETASQPAASGEGSPHTDLLSTSSLEEFLSGNTQFYGKKISLEVSQMDVREVFKLISEESGINLVLSDDVKGTVTLKIRQVPWDQALVVIMKARKLGYTRAGNVLRIAPLADIKAEEDDTVKLATARKAMVPLKVRMIPVSYAKIDELTNQIKPFLSERGKAVGDVRTSAMVVSDLDENLDRVAKLIASIDVPPPQVLIEGKIVEASEQFQRSIGINWSAAGQEGLVGYSMGHRPIRGRTGITVSPSIASSAAQLNFQLGTLDILGDLSATLALFEQQNTVKVLSSPRIVTLHNEPAEINQSTEVPLIKETANPGGAITRTVDFKPVKLRLQVTPQITNDASVIMGVDVSRDFLMGKVDPSDSAQAVATRSAKTKVMVRNAQTAVIGGIYQADQTNGETRVPWVGEIPIVGWLFKSKSTQNVKNELLIFLTPRILGQADSQTIPSQGTGGTIE